MDKCMNGHHSCGNYLLFIATIRTATFSKHWFHLVLRKSGQNRFAVSEMLSLSHVVQKIPLL